jgi:hypothetical protein
MKGQESMVGQVQAHQLGRVGLVVNAVVGDGALAHQNGDGVVCG